MNNQQQYEDEVRIRVIKRQNRRLKHQNISLKIWLGIFVLLFLGTSGSAAYNKYTDTKQIEALTKQVNVLAERNDSLTEDAKNISDNYNILADNFKKVSSISVSLNSANLILTTELKKQNNELTELRNRKELYDKYDYAIERSDGSRTDITYDDIENLQELCNEKGLSSNTVDLILAIAMNESQGHEEVKNPTSSATGLCGFLSGTGKFVYTKLMGKTSYTHYTTAKDGSTNLEMAVNYIAYLDKSHNGNMIGILSEYSGGSGTEYAAKLQKYLSKKELNVLSFKLS